MTRKKVRYPDPISDGLFDRMAEIDKGVSFADKQLTGLRARGLVNSSGRLTPVGKQVLDLRRDLTRSQERIAQLRHGQSAVLSKMLKK